MVPLHVNLMRLRWLTEKGGVCYAPPHVIADQGLYPGL